MLSFRDMPAALSDSSMSHTSTMSSCKEAPNNKIISIYGPVLIALCDPIEAMDTLSNPQAIFVQLSIDCDDQCDLSADSLLCPSNIGQIYHFKNLVDVTMENEKCSNIVLCIGVLSRNITLCSFLVGAYAILCQEASLSSITRAFQPIEDRFEGFMDGAYNFADALTVQDCWEAVHCAKVQGWLDFTSASPDLDRCIDMDEYMHYDAPANGKLHVIIPTRLIAFPCPSDLPADPASGEAPQWLDVEGGRRFGPHYYADVLGDFDVQLVVRCDAAASYDEGAFGASGIAVERLGAKLDEQPQRLLQEVDRFLTLARLAPGMVGMHGGDEGGLGRGGELLVSSLLIKRHGFRARSALAWLRLTHPSAALPACRFAIVDRPAPPSGLPRCGSAAELRGPARIRPIAETLLRRMSAPGLLQEAAAELSVADTTLQPSVSDDMMPACR